MAVVPNNDSFTFFDVTTAVYGDNNAGRNLTSAFADATGTFDPAYVDSKTNLLNFRNYIATIYTYTSLGNTTSTVTVCADYPNVGTTTAYGLFPFVDLTSPYVIYSDFACTTPVVPTGSKWYYSDGATWIAIDGSGNVTDNGVCPTTTTTTTVAPTTTTTTTLPITYYGYTVNEYLAPYPSMTCTANGSRTIANTFNTAVIGKFYRSNNGSDDCVFEVLTSGVDISAGGYLITSFEGAGASTCTALLPLAPL